MNRTDLVAAVARRSGLTQAESQAAIEALEQELVAAVGGGEVVRLPGILTMDVVDRPARAGRNPQSGEAMEIPAGKSVRLRPGSQLKAAARSGEGG